MTSSDAWAPAPRPGIVPLQPLGFGRILGSSFSALRHNPRVLFGFALTVQIVASLIVIAAIGGAAIATFGRLASAVPESEEYFVLFDGSVAITGAVTLVVGIGSTVLTTIVSGVVIAEVARGVVAERRSLGDLWRESVRPVAGRLVGYSLLVLAALVVGFGLLAAGLLALGFAALPLAIALTVFAILGAIPLLLWLSVKLLMVPAVIVLEQAGIRTATARSWRLSRTRFWPILGIVVIVSLAFQTVAQVISVPLSIVSGALVSVVSPTGGGDAQALIGFIVTTLVTQLLLLIVQAVQLIVTSTATTLIYTDSRMRAEGLDLDLLEYVEARESGQGPTGDPYRRHIGRILPPSVGYAPPPVGPFAPPVPPDTRPAAAPGPDPRHWAAPGSAPE